MKNFIKVAIVIAVFFGLSLAAKAGPIPGGGSVNVSQSADMCTVTIGVKGTAGRTVIEAIGYIAEVNDTLVESAAGVNPTLVVKVPRGYTTDLTVETVRGNKVVDKQSVRSSCRVNVYTTPGEHYVNGREWKTTCERYSITKRCTTHIKSAGKWVFNNMTYLPSARTAWASNPLGGYGKYGYKGTWKSSGRQWKVECDTAKTGRGACRSYIMSGSQWVINNIVLFK